MNIFQLSNFAIENLALIFSAYLITKALSKNKITTLGKLILSVFILYISEILLIEILLGIFGAISQTNVAIFVYSSTIITTILLRKNIPKKLEIPKIKLPIFTLLAVFTPISVALFIRFFNNMLQIPMEYDSVYYHLPFMAQWLQSGSLMTPFYSAFSGPIGNYPSNYELLDLWLTIPFKNDIFLNLLNFPILILFGITIYKICRNFAISKRISIISTSLIFYMPVFLKEIGTPLVDIFFGLTFAISIYFLQEIYKEKNEKFNLLAFGLSLGIFIGTKYLGLAYLIVPVIIFLIICRRIKPILIVLLGIFLTGSFFYIRNIITTGNPLFPVEINLFGHTLLEGYPGINDYIGNTTLLGNLNNFAAIKKFAGILYHQAGFQFALMGIAIFGSTVHLSYQTFINKNRKLFPAWTLILSSITLFLLYLKAPYTFSLEIENVRFATPFFALGCVAVAYFINTFSKLKNLFYLIYFVTISYSLSHLISFHPADLALTHDYKIYIILLGISFSTLAYGLFPKNFKNKKITIIISIISLLISFFTFWETANFAIPERNKLLSHFNDDLYGNDPRVVNLVKAAEWFNQNSPHAKIAYTSFNFHYHLYGPDLSREVDYVNINNCSNCDYFNYRKEKNGIRSNPNYENWLKNLALKQKEYLVIDTKFTAGVTQYELDWTAQHPEKFKLVWKKDNTYIYKISL